MPLEFTFVCPLPNGFHARPASHIASVANGFASDCALTNSRNGLAANIKSVLSLIAADIRMNDECRVRVSGEDEQPASAALQRFIGKDLPACDVPLADFVPKPGERTLPRPFRSEGLAAYFGLPVSPGIGYGKAIVIGDIKPAPTPNSAAPADSMREQQRVKRSIAAVRARIQRKLSGQISATETAILQAHLAILGDVSLLHQLLDRIAQGRSAAQAVREAGEFFDDLLRQAESAYIRERALDVQDICLALLQEIEGPGAVSPVRLSEPSVIVAANLTPQQLLALDRKWTTALLLESAGTTSHTVILARSLSIPALVGAKEALHVLSPGQQVVVDANRGFFLPQWTPLVRRFYERELSTMERRRAALIRRAMAPAATVDGRRIEVAANVSSAAELGPAFERGADGIGLFRTEMLFLGRDAAPSEEEQFAVYAQAAREARGKPVILRTLDVGGDKPVPYLGIPTEENPFLGCRGMRMYPLYQELVRTQLRAILRASAFGCIQLMVPMVSTVAEMQWVKAQVKQLQDELKAEGIAFDPSMPLGVMIEIPSAAFILDSLCEESDFFSMGTNDLSQYFFAVDRANPGVASLSNVRHPGFLRFLQQIVDGVHKHKKWIGICGEMAGELRNLPLLVGLGLNEISVASAEIPRIKECISRLSVRGCEELFSRALMCRDAEQVESLLGHTESSTTTCALLDRDLIVLESDSLSKQEAIREIIDAFYIQGRTDDPDRLEDAVWARESVYSTGLGHGFAIPHCKTDAVNTGSIGFLKLKKPVDWEALDGSPVRMVILLASRESGADGAHLQVFSLLARKLMEEDFREQLLQAGDVNRVLSCLADEFDVPA